MGAKVSFDSHSDEEDLPNGVHESHSGQSKSTPSNKTRIFLIFPTFSLLF